MRQIRYGTFETNSSSTHSIVVSKDILKSDDANFYPERKFNYYFNDAYCFSGRGSLELYNEWDNKLAYIMIALCERYKRKTIKKFEKRVIRLFYDLLEDKQLLFEDGTPENIFKSIRRNMKDSYIDHCGNVPKEFLDRCLTDDEFLKSFLFNSKDSYVACGGDEYNGYYIKTIGFEDDYPYVSGKWFDKYGNEVNPSADEDYFYATKDLIYVEQGEFWKKLEEYKKNHYVYMKGN